MEWDEISHTVQEDLINWYNILDIDENDKAILSKLYSEGKFHAWTCPNCKDSRCFFATPDNWDDFQGVLQNDYSSYPGAMLFCDDCRYSPRVRYSQYDETNWTDALKMCEGY